MNTVRRPLMLATLLLAILAGCAGTQANTTHDPAQAGATPSQQPTNVPF